MPSDKSPYLRVPPEEIQVQKTRKVIELYVCPTQGCTSATVTKPGEKLEEEWTGVKSENRQAKAVSSGSEWSHNRAECPDCRQRGNPVQRVRVAVPVDVPMVGPPTPPLPPPSGQIHAQPVSKPEG